MTHQLWLFRHAKSDWDNALPDQQRPLSKRGLKNAIRMGQWMSENRLLPDRIISSTAERAFQTCEYLQQGFQGDLNVPVWDERLYQATPEIMLEIISEQSEDIQRLMLVGHNPGMDDFLIWLCGDEKLPRTKKGKLMTTSTLAIVELSDGWQNIQSRKNVLVQIARPKEI